MQKRREFIKLGAALGSGIMLTSVAGKLAGCSSLRGENVVNRAFGLQLYTLRDEMPKDPKGVLRQVASFGYKQIESFEGPKGMFWGMKNTEFKQLMDDLGMQIIASHCNIDADFERKAGEAAAIGMQYLISPWLGPQKSLDDYKTAADKFNNRGEICKRAGLRFAYHNHDYTFLLQEGQYPQQVLMQNTDSNLVDYEMDMYWVVTAGQNPIEWLTKYPNRFRLGHVKDRKKGEPLSETNASVTLGQGSINYSDILDKAESKGMRYFVVEQERYDGTTPLKATQDNATFMKNLKL